MLRLRMPARRDEISKIQELLSEEQGVIRKTGALRVALCYPSPYHVGMSSLGFQTLYRQINQHPNASCERAFLPDSLEPHRQARLPVLTFESQTPIGNAAVVAFSVAYELEITGMFAVLEVSGIPALREQRTSAHPLIIAGGPLTFSNPTPLEPFVDVLVQGEAEEVIHVFLTAALEMDREQLLEHLSKVPGQILTPHTELRSMFLIEPERGCSRGCHYCVMRRTTNGGMRTLPLDRILSLIPEEARRVGLVGAAVTDHPQIAQLLRKLVDSGREVGVSSLRADRLTQELVNLLRRGGAKVLTVASDGASQRMRDLVDRKHTEEQILRSAQLGRAAGMSHLKVYNMVGLPAEQDVDIDEMIAFTVELSRIVPVALGVAPFVAKRNTPMDGSPFAGIEVIEDRLARLRAGLKGRAEVRPTSARWAWVEYMLAQSGAEAGLAAFDAYRAGGAFAAFKRAFESRAVVPFLERRTPDGRRNPTVWPTVSAPAAAAAV